MFSNFRFFSFYRKMASLLVYMQNITKIPERFAKSFRIPLANENLIKNLIRMKWVHGLMITKTGFDFHDRNTNPIMCLIMDDGLRQVFYILPQPRRCWPFLDQPCTIEEVSINSSINKKRIACDQIFPEKVMHKNANNIVKIMFRFHEYNGNFVKMVTEIIK